MTDTPTQILETSRTLFNEQGVENVSVAQIAGELGISAGNLTYHFAKKQLMVAQHLSQLEESMVKTLEGFSYDGNAAEFLDAFTEILQITWDYRYLFNGTTFLLQKALLTKLEYSRVVEHIYDVLLMQIDKMIEFGSMQAIPRPYENRTLVDCVWWQWLGWLDANQLLMTEQHESQQEMLDSAIRHQMFLVSPYLSSAFRKELQEELTRQ